MYYLFWVKADLEIDNYHEYKKDLCHEFARRMPDHGITQLYHPHAQKMLMKAEYLDMSKVPKEVELIKMGAKIKRW